MRRGALCETSPAKSRKHEYARRFLSCYNLAIISQNLGQTTHFLLLELVACGSIDDAREVLLSVKGRVGKVGRLSLSHLSPLCVSLSFSEYSVSPISIRLPPSLLNGYSCPLLRGALSAVYWYCRWTQQSSIDQWFFSLLRLDPQRAAQSLCLSPLFSCNQFYHFLYPICPNLSNLFADDHPFTPHPTLFAPSSSSTSFRPQLAGKIHRRRGRSGISLRKNCLTSFLTLSHISVGVESIWDAENTS